MGKGAGDKKTTDFGACRDLYGRRLRHVNDEIKLKKWLEAKEREQEDRGGWDLSSEVVGICFIHMLGSFPLWLMDCFAGYLI